MSKVFIFIDGSNFYHKLKELTKDVDEPISLLDFDYTKFFSWLIKPDELQEARYYIGALKRKRNDPKSEKVYADQQRLVAKLQQHKVIITFGQMIQHPDKSIHEKGVDVRLAVEMIRFARENKYDTTYLLSSDTDLVPAVEEVKSFNKKVTYIGIVKGQSFGLTKASDDTRLLRFEDIEPFLPKPLPLKINYNEEDILDHHGVAAIIKNQKGEILMQEHVKYGFWTIPVGKVKDDQNVIDGLKQEILEECNLQIKECEEIIVKDYFYERNGNNVKVISHLFEILKYSGKMENLEPMKHKQQVFLPIEQIKKLPYLSDLTLLYLEQVGFKRQARL